MTDEDIYAFRPVPQPAAGAPVGRPRRRLWPWILAAALVLGLVAAVATASALFDLVADAPHSLHLHVNGDDWDSLAIDGDSLHAHWALIVAGLTLAMSAVFLVVVIVVPLAVLLGLLAATLAIGLALLVVAGVAAVALSPLWGLGLLLWLIFRRRPTPANA